MAYLNALLKKKNNLFKTNVISTNQRWAENWREEKSSGFAYQRTA
jgi:hypothetical protein